MASRIAIGLVGAFVGAIACLLWLRPPPEPAAAHSHATQLEQPGPRLRALEDERDQLRAELDGLRALLDARPTDAASASAPPTPAATPPGLASPTPILPSTLAGLALPPEFRGFDDRSLYAVGVDADEVERLRLVFDEYELDAGALFSKAQTEGWLTSPRYQRGREALLERYKKAREEMGDEAFDRLLYGARKPNRLVLSHVPERSVAGQVDLRIADLIMSYDGERIFTRDDLAFEIARGLVGETVRVEVLRDSVSVVVWVPRAELGASLAAIRQPPLPTR